MYTPEPMNDSLPVPPQWATVLAYAYAVPNYAYPRGTVHPACKGHLGSLPPPTTTVRDLHNHCQINHIRPLDHRYLDRQLHH